MSGEKNEYQIDFSKTIDAVKSTLESFVRIDWSVVVDEFIQGVNIGLKNAEQEYKTIMLRAGYPPISNLHINKTMEIIKLKDEPQISTNLLNELLFKYYDEVKTDALLTKLHDVSWINKRVPIFEQSFKAHHQGDYFLSVATILPQIEGMFADATNTKGKMSGRVLEAKVKEVLGSNVKLFNFNKEIENFYLKTILVGFEHNKPVKSFLSRHAILHGGDVEYGTRENSLRCIMLLEFLFAKLNRYLRKSEIEAIESKGIYDLDDL